MAYPSRVKPQYVPVKVLYEQYQQQKSQQSQISDDKVSPSTSRLENEPLQQSQPNLHRIKEHWNNRELQQTSQNQLIRKHPRPLSTHSSSSVTSLSSSLSAQTPRNSGTRLETALLVQDAYFVDCHGNTVLTNIQLRIPKGESELR